MSLTQVNLVSDVPGTAIATDPKLVNPWGSFVDNKGDIWCAINGSKAVVMYERNRYYPALSVTTTGAPTGIVNTACASYDANFVVVTENGTIEAYIPTTSTTGTIVKVGPNSANVFKGVTMLMGMLYVANFSQGSVDVYDSSYTLIPTLSIVDVGLKSLGYMPFNVYSYKGSRTLYISYALKSGTDDVKGIGNGYLSVYKDNTLTRLYSRGPLNSPWGMIRADNDLYVGNFGDGVINKFRLSKHCTAYKAEYCGVLTNSCCGAIINDGLWSLVCMKDHDILFTAGSQEESHGLIGILKSGC